MLIRFQKEVSHGLPASVTYAGDIVKDPNKRKLLDLLNAPSEIGRPYILSKAVPADRLSILRDAFDKTMKDAQFNADADKQQLIIDPIQGVKVAGMLKELYATPPDVVKEAKAITGE